MYSDDLIGNTAVILKRGDMARSAFGVLRAYVRHKVAEAALNCSTLLCSPRFDRLLCAEGSNPASVFAPGIASPSVSYLIPPTPFIKMMSSGFFIIVDLAFA